jgi:Fe-S cluster assembly iron-binding protein IscA
MRLAILLSTLLLAGCSSKPTQVYTPAPTPPAPRPFIDIAPAAKILLEHFAAERKLGPNWHVRLVVDWTAEPEIKVTIERDPPGEGDHVVEAAGLKVAMPGDQKVYFKGAVITLDEARGKAWFGVEFFNRDERDIELASKWFKAEKAKRKK